MRASTYVFAPPEVWVKGDYRYGAHLKKGTCSIETLAQKVAAKLEEYVEEGLGPAKCFGVRSSSGRQVGFETFELGPGGIEILVLFENGTCKRSDITDALAFFEVSESSVSWFAPGIIDV